MHIGETMVLALLAFAGLGIALYLLTLYNGMVALKNSVGRAWANIDVLLKQRHDEIPKLVKTVEGYMQHERGVFDKLSEARGALMQAKNVPQRAEAEGQITRALGQLFAVAENYPDLKANQNFLALQAELSNTEDRLQTARRFYNSNVRDYNRRVQSFPSNVIARSFGFTQEQFFEVDESLRGDAGVPRVDFVGEAPGVTFGGQPGNSGPGTSAPAQTEPGDAPPPPPTPPS